MKHTDGTADVLWQNQSTGVVGAWIIKNAMLNAWAGFGQADPALWKIVGGSQSSSSAFHATNVVSAPTQDVAPLTQSDLQPIVQEAIARWANTGLDASSLARLTQVQFAIRDLGGSLLGTAEANRVTIDINAAGNGWFVDSTPTLDEEFSLAGNARLNTIDPRAVDRIDLLTVVEHELGHVLGYHDLDALANDLMSDTLESGVRKTPYKDRADAAFATL